MKSSTDSQQMKNCRWRGDLATKHEWSPTQRWLLIAMFIIALAV
ncbi:hypothetical protein [Sporomusa ovata]|uniref:Uncharacterized protein n=1 Tax=Sporomusa ovata TaxID=2378 RepID=A0A0U1L0Z9_9FIRM|nr:hypothetical protein [Sporomusa ovata]CQR73342.1 hypothetical protein SpAn4DRAFT_2574 [Sporomusa ovata]